jgi:DNA repair ATPase RecN
MKKAKKTKEQKRTELLRSQDELIRSQHDRIEYLEEKLKDKGDEIDRANGKLDRIENSIDMRLETMRQHNCQLMEIIRWQIKPESALQKEKNMTTGKDTLDYSDLRNGFHSLRNC